MVNVRLLADLPKALDSAAAGTILNKDAGGLGFDSASYDDLGATGSIDSAALLAIANSSYLSSRISTGGFNAKNHLDSGVGNSLVPDSSGRTVRIGNYSKPINNLYLDSASTVYIGSNHSFNLSSSYIEFNGGTASSFATVAAVTAIDADNITYDNLSLDVSARITGQVNSVQISSDGTKLMFLDGYTGSAGSRNFYKYTLSSALDISTASWSASHYDQIAENTYPQEARFTNNGNNVHAIVAGSANSPATVSDSLLQYTTSSAYAITLNGLTYNNESVYVNQTVPLSFRFNPDGTKVYICGRIADTVKQWSLSSPYDVGTMSDDSVSLSIGSQDTEPRSIAFSSDGSKMFMVGATSNLIYQYGFTTPWDISSGSYEKSWSPTEDNDWRGIDISSDDTKIYLIGNQNKYIYQYSTGVTG